MDLTDFAARCTAARLAYDKANEALKTAKDELDAAEREMTELMLVNGLDATTIDGVTFTPRRTTKYGCSAENRPQLLDLLEEDGYRDLFTVNPGTLSNVIAEMAAQREDGEVPERYRGIVTEFEKKTLSVRGLKGRQ